MAKVRALPNAQPATSLASILTRVFSVDLRSLALLRIGLGALVLAAVGEAARDSLLFYVDDGPWPIAAALTDPLPPGRWSLHFLSGSFAWQAVLATTEALAGLAVLLGWRTSATVPLAWLLTISAQSRSGLVLGGGSTLLRLLLFWGMWLPLGARWSLDARRRGSPPPAQTVCSAATAALLLQIAAIYFLNVLYKSGPAWHSRGDAVAMTMHCEIYARPLGRTLLAWPALLGALTPLVYWLEALGPLLAFSPWGTARVRSAVVALFLAFHAGLAMTMNLGNFPFTCMVAWLAFIPGWVWSRQPPAESVPLRSGLLPNLGAALAFSYVLAWNLRGWIPSILPRPVLSIGQVLRLDQRWEMFSPEPWKTEGWLVVVGTEARGRETNLLTGASPVDWRRPPDLGVLFPNTAWRKYSLSVAREGHGQRARWYAEWLARQWQRTHPSAAPFVRLEVYYLATSIYDHTAVPDNYLLFETPPSSTEKAAEPAKESPPP